MTRQEKTIRSNIIHRYGWNFKSLSESSTLYDIRYHFERAQEDLFFLMECSFVSLKAYLFLIDLVITVFRRKMRQL